jgi:hypothetical protein
LKSIVLDPQNTSRYKIKSILLPNYILMRVEREISKYENIPGVIGKINNSKENN